MGARCDHWIGEQRRFCHATDGVRPYLIGDRCPAHTPAAIAGRPELDAIPRTPVRRGGVRPGPRTVARDALPAFGAALAYARRGWPVFLLGRSKRPVANCRSCPKDAPGHDPDACSCLTCHGFYAATVDPGRIAAMFEAVPGGLLAIRTGAASGLVVVDIDPRNGGAIDRALMVATATVGSGGGGWHLYYAHPGGTIPSGKLRTGVDIKAEGGYVVAPPSIHPGSRRRYRWIGARPVVEMPAPLLAAYRQRPAASPPPPAVPAFRPPQQLRGGGGISCPDALLTANLDAVRRAPDGSRRVTLYGACRGVARMVAAGAMTAEAARAALTATGRAVGGITEREIRAAIDGGFHDEGIAA